MKQKTKSEYIRDIYADRWYLSKNQRNTLAVDQNISTLRAYDIITLKTQPTDTEWYRFLFKYWWEFQEVNIMQPHNQKLMVDKPN